jgi:hypothetical protein
MDRVIDGPSVRTLAASAAGAGRAGRAPEAAAVPAAAAASAPAVDLPRDPVADLAVVLAVDGRAGEFTKVSFTCEFLR